MMQKKRSAAMRLLLGLLMIAGATAAITVGILNWETPASAWRRRALEQGAPDLVNQRTDSPLWMPSITTPTLIDADKAGLPDDDKVIGVIVGDQQRAYCLSAMGGIGEQVVEDTFNNKAITVIYSARSNFARVFGNDLGPGSHQIQVNSFMSGRMQIQYRGSSYELDAENIPLPDWKFERTTWKEWKDRYPQTKAYIKSPIFAESNRDDEIILPKSISEWTVHEIRPDDVSDPERTLTIRAPTSWQFGRDDKGFDLQPPVALGPSVKIDGNLSEVAVSENPQQYFEAAFRPSEVEGPAADRKVRENELVQVGQFPARRWIVDHGGEAARTTMVYAIWTGTSGLRLAASGDRQAMKRWQRVLSEICQSVTPQR